MGGNIGILINMSCKCGHLLIYHFKARQLLLSKESITDDTETRLVQSKIIKTAGIFCATPNTVKSRDCHCTIEKYI